MNTEDETSERTPVDDHVFSLLPFGLRSDFAVDGWITDVAPDSDGDVMISYDHELKEEVLELKVRDFYKVSVSFPDDSKFIGTPFPFLVIHMKNMERYTAFEIDVEDKNKRMRKFRASNAQSVTRVLNDVCTLPLKLDPGWNNVVV
eukprot:96700_1